MANDPDSVAKDLGAEPSIHRTASVRASTFGRYCEVGARTKVAESSFGDYSYVVNDSDIIYTTVGKFCSIAAHTRINPGNHPLDRVMLSHVSYRSSAYGLGPDEGSFFDWRRSKPGHARPRRLDRPRRHRSGRRLDRHRCGDRRRHRRHQGRAALRHRGRQPRPGPAPALPRQGRRSRCSPSPGGIGRTRSSAPPWHDFRSLGAEEFCARYARLLSRRRRSAGKRMLKVAVQMDPIETVNIDGDSTFALMLEAQRRGHACGTTRCATCRCMRARTRARAASAAARPRPPGHRAARRRRPLPVRRPGDPRSRHHGRRPDAPGSALRHGLHHRHPHARAHPPAHAGGQRSPPRARRAGEAAGHALSGADAADPGHLGPEAIRAFRREHRDIIVKPLFGNGGAGVFRIREDDENLASLLEMHFARSREPLMIQRYEPAVRQGDKRVILVDGEPLGAINRVPAQGEARSNMHVGGRPEKVALTAARPRDLPPDRPASARPRPDLRRHRRDRRLPDRDQRHLADRPAGGRAASTAST